MVTAPSREVLEGYVIPRLAEFLAGRGLELSQAKTRIVHIDDGFDFLGFNPGVAFREGQGQSQRLPGRRAGIARSGWGEWGRNPL
jgi:hypothetical protein